VLYPTELRARGVSLSGRRGALQGGGARPWLLAGLLWLGIDGAAALEVRPGALVEIEGREVVLADVVVPRLARADSGDWRMGAARGEDRWGRAVVTLVDGERSLAATLLASGEALVSPDASGEGLALLLRLEAEAREAGRGLWRLRRFRVQDAQAVRGDTGELVLVEGEVHAVGWAADRLYLNFAENFRTDFTARLGRADVRALARSGLDPEALQGRRVRLRGWLRYAGGPLIDIQGPAQIEVLR
jgi:micrococcal nuclease